MHVFYIDVRTPGKNFDEFYRRAVEQYGVDYIKGMVGKVDERERQADGAGQRPYRQRAGDDRCRHGGAGHRDRARSHGALRSATMLTASHGYQRLLHRGASQAPPRGKPHGGRIPLRRVRRAPRTSPKPSPRRVRRRREGHRPAGQGSPGHQPVRGSVQRAIVQRLLAVRKGLPLRRDHLRRQGSSRPRRARGTPHRRRSTRLCARAAAPAPSPARPGAMDLKGFSNKQIMAEVDAICR